MQTNIPFSSSLSIDTFTSLGFTVSLAKVVIVLTAIFSVCLGSCVSLMKGVDDFTIEIPQSQQIITTTSAVQKGQSELENQSNMMTTKSVKENISRKQYDVTLTWMTDGDAMFEEKINLCCEFNSFITKSSSNCNQMKLKWR